MFKFGFRIKTRSGLGVDNLLIHARDQAEAEKKLGQMYRHCQIVECRVLDSPLKQADAVDLDRIISVLSKKESSILPG